MLVIKKGLDLDPTFPRGEVLHYLCVHVDTGVVICRCGLPASHFRALFGPH